MLKEFMHRVNTPWPENLVDDIYTRNRKATPRDLPTDLEQTVDFLLSRLSESEETVIRGLYQDKQPAFRVANQTHLFTSQVKNKHQRAIRKLSSPWFIKYLRYGLSEFTAYTEQQARAAGARSRQSIMAMPIPTRLSLSLCNLYLPPQTYSALVGNEISTIQDLIQKLRIGAIWGVPGLERNDWDDIHAQLDAFGLLPADMKDDWLRRQK